MARIVKMQGASPNLPVDEAAAPRGMRCVGCRKPADRRYHNAWRAADSCGDQECRSQAMAWAANRPYGRPERHDARPVMRPPQVGKMHPLVTRDVGPRAAPPGPRDARRPSAVAKP